MRLLFLGDLVGRAGRTAELGLGSIFPLVPSPSSAGVLTACSIPAGTAVPGTPVVPLPSGGHGDGKLGSVKPPSVGGDESTVPSSGSGSTQNSTSHGNWIAT